MAIWRPLSPQARVPVPLIAISPTATTLPERTLPAPEIVTAPVPDEPVMITGKPGAGRVRRTLAPLTRTTPSAAIVTVFVSAGQRQGEALLRS